MIPSLRSVFFISLLLNIYLIISVFISVKFAKELEKDSPRLHPVIGNWKVEQINIGDSQDIINEKSFFEFNEDGYNLKITNQHSSHKITGKYSAFNKTNFIIIISKGESDVLTSNVFDCKLNEVYDQSLCYALTDKKRFETTNITLVRM